MDYLTEFSALNDSGTEQSQAIVIDDSSDDDSKREAMLNRKKNISRNTTKRYECCFCQKSFGRNKSLLNIHMLFHSGDQPFICRYCSRVFAVKENFKNHMTMHVEPQATPIAGSTKLSKTVLFTTTSTIYPTNEIESVHLLAGNGMDTSATSVQELVSIQT